MDNTTALPCLHIDTRLRVTSCVFGLALSHYGIKIGILMVESHDQFTNATLLVQAGTDLKFWTMSYDLSCVWKLYKYYTTL